MEKLLRTSAWLMAVLFVVGMVGLTGCGEEETTTEEAAQLVKTVPEDGAEIAQNGEVTLTFDKAPDTVTVNGKEYTGAKTVKVKLEEIGIGLGQQTLDISWEPGGGSATLTLNVVEADTTPPELVKSEPVSDGDENVEYDGLTEIKLTFSEPMDTTKSRVIQIAPEGGDPLNWSVSWESDDTVAVLTAGKGGELTAETTYVITAKSPTDKAGNKADDITITFKTRPKE